LAKSPTANFTTEKNKTSGAEIRTLLEIDASSGTLYYSDQALTVDAQAYTANVLTWPSQITSQIVPGEEVVRIANAPFVLNNNPRVDADIEPGLEIRIYLWFDGLTTADKLLWFTGTISEDIQFDIYTISFTAADIGAWFDKEIGQPLDVTTYPNADPDDIGKIQPILYGDLTDQPCLAIVAGAVSTLVNDIAIGASSIELTDASAFPSSGTLIIGDEEDITYSGKSTNTLTGVANVSNAYARASRVMEKIAQLEYMVASHPVKAITNPRILPSGMKVEDAVRIDSGDFTANISDGGIATVDITEIANVKKAVEVVVTQQPDVDSTGQPTPSITPSTHDHPASNVIVTVNLEDTVLISASGAQTRANWALVSYLVDSNYNSKGKWTCNSSVGTPNCTIRCSRVSLKQENGTPVQMRFAIKNTLSSATGTAKLYILGVLKQTVTLAGGTQYSNQYSFSNWSDINAANTYVEIYTQGTVANQYVEVNEVWLEITYTPSSPDKTLTPANTTVTIATETLTKTIVGGNSVADTLGGILIVDCEGTPDDNPAHYTDVADSLIKEPWDIIHHILENYGNGVTDSDIDLAGSFQDAEDNLPSSYEFAFSIRQKIAMNRLLAMLAQQTWCRFVWEAGVAKLNRIKESGVSSKAIDTDTDSILSRAERLQVVARKRSLNKIFNDIEVKSNLNYTLGSWDAPDAYKDSSETTDANSITNFGTRQRTWLMFAIGDNSSMANDVRDKLLDFYKLSRKEFIFPGWLKNVELERGDLVELTTTQLGINDRLCEIIGVDYSMSIPIQRRNPELNFRLLDLAVILEELLITAASAINITDFQIYNEELLVTAASTISITEVYDPQVESLSITAASAISTIDSTSFNFFDTPWCGAVDNKLYLTSGQFESTLKTSEAVGAIDVTPTGISYDGIDTPWCGTGGDKLYLTSGQFTSTIKDSIDVSAVEETVTGISWDGTNTPVCGSFGDKLYLVSGQFGAVLKTSLSVGGIDTEPTDISWDSTNTPWCGSEADKLYLQSGQFESTLKTSEDVSGVDSAPSGISYDGINTLWCGSTDDKLYLTSGQFTSTLKTSEDVSGIDLLPNGIETNDATGRADIRVESLSIIAASTISVTDIQTYNPESLLTTVTATISETDIIALLLSFTATATISETDIYRAIFDTPWCGVAADKLYLTSGQFESTLKTSEDVSSIDIGNTGISYDGIDTPWCGLTDDKLYLTSGQFESTLKTSRYIGGIDTAPQGISYDGTDTPWCGAVADKLYLTSGQFESTLRTSRFVGGIDSNPRDICTNNINGRLGV
jgi:hypothetical protein